MKILVAIANYGTKNAAYAKRVIDEYRAMPFEVDIVVMTEVAKGYGDGVAELVGLPTKDPRSLPFGHKKLFARNVDRYDLFIYTEDDTLITERSIRAFLRASSVLPEELLPGYIRFELHPDGRKNYPDIHGPFHWVPSSVGRRAAYTYADLSNDHSACYVMTKRQLQRAVASGGFDVPPHAGRYDLLESAATDPYTQCGFKRVVCVSHIDEFELHHLPNAYLDRTGLAEDDYRAQIDALLDVSRNERGGRQLFVTEKRMATTEWDKSYYEPCREELLRHVPGGATKVLSIGCGSGSTEARLIERGQRVTAIPLDAVIGCVAGRRGIRVLPPDFSDALRLVTDERFDVIVMADVLQHVERPMDLLARLWKHLAPEGVLVGSVPNLSAIHRLSARLVVRHRKWTGFRGSFDETALHLTSRRGIRRWLEGGGFRPRQVNFDRREPLRRLRTVAARLPEEVTASNIVFVAGVVC